MSVSITPITDREGAERQARIERAIGSVRLELLEPTDAAMPILQPFVAGDRGF